LFGGGKPRQTADGPSATSEPVTGTEPADADPPGPDDDKP
jgi:hypothetical protein